MAEKCVCHINGYELKDAKARKRIEEVNENSAKYIDELFSEKEKELALDTESINRTIAEHTDDLENPHGVTREQIGAAPSGFGLGEYAKIDGILLSDQRKSGWYSFEGANIQAGAHTITKGVLRVDAMDENNLVQTIYYSFPSLRVLRRIRVNGALGDWEWENPPMEHGKEYRTTKRIAGKKVYTKRIACGAPSRNTKAVVSSGIRPSENPHFISVRAVGYYDNYGIVTKSFSYNGEDPQGASVWMDNEDIDDICWITIHTGSDYFAEVDVYLEYTKG